MHSHLTEGSAAAAEGRMLAAAGDVFIQMNRVKPE